MTQTFEMVKADLEKREGGLARIMPDGVEPKRFISLVLRACRTTPKLLACDRASFFMAVSKAAEIGLEPNTALSHGWLIPYGNQCQFVPGYKGFIELAARTAKVKIWARVVYEGDTFEWIEGTEPKIVHKPKAVETADDKITHAYAVAKFPDGEIQFEVMRRNEIETIRNRSQSARSSHSPWTTDFPAMCKKTPIRRLANVLPLRHEKWAKLVELDNDDYVNGGPVTVQAEQPVEPPKRRGRKPKEPSPTELTPEEKRDFGVRDSNQSDSWMPVSDAKIVKTLTPDDPGYIREPGEEG